jgi:hypothetical protein
MQRESRRRWLVSIVWAIAAVAIGICITIVFINPALTRYVESPSFRAALE